MYPPECLISRESLHSETLPAAMSQPTCDDDVLGPLTSGPFAGSERYLSFHVTILQQPSRSRMTGFGEKDRRPIDPPPVVKLSVIDPLTGPVPESEIDIDTLICHASLWNATATEPRGLVFSPSAIIDGKTIQSAAGGATVVPFPEPVTEMDAVPMRNLLGSLTTSAKCLKDENGVVGIMFVFQDLAVRTEGTWVIRFAVSDLDTRIRGGDPDAAPELCHIFTQPFRVFPAKNFPGMRESSALTKALSRQGVKVILRKSGEDDASVERDGSGDA